MIKISALILLIPFTTFWQIDNRGLILPKIDSLKNSGKYCCILSPSEGFEVYDRPKGNIIGILKRFGDAKKDDQVPYKIYLISGNKKIQIDNYREIGYEIFAINYTDVSDGFVKVLDPSKSHWLSVSEINKKDFKTVNWMDYLINQSADVLGYYAKDSGLNLRKEPNANSDGKYGTPHFAVFDYTVGRDITDQLIVVNTDAGGNLDFLSWES